MCIRDSDIIVGNPPFNVARQKACGHTLWQLFIHKILNVTLTSNGYLAFMHPPMWRKPILTKRSPNNGLYQLLCCRHQMIYLSIQNKKEGNKDLGCNTRYDWYIVKKDKVRTVTIIKDEYNEISEIYLPNYNWIPNSNITKIYSLTDGKKIPLLYSRNAYSPENNWVSSVEDKIYCYPLIHSTPKKGIQYRYSKVNNRGHFGIPKVIFGEGGIHHCIIDMEGKYGMTQGAMAIQVFDYTEAQHIKNILVSKTFQHIIDSCCFSAYRIDWCVLSLLSYKVFDIIK